MQIHRRWPIDWVRAPAPAGQLATALLVPDFPVPRGMPAQAAALLPNTRYNHNLLESLAQRSASSASSEVATVFAADPFLNVDLHARALRRRGISRLANLPTMALLGQDFLSISGQVGMGVDIEFERLDRFASHGFELFVVVSEAGRVQDALRAGAAAIIVAVAIAEDPEQADETRLLADLCSQVMEAAGGACPVLALAAERLTAFDTPVEGVIRTVI